MSRRAQTALFLAGAAVFALMLRRIGVAEIAANATAVGRLFLAILALYGVGYACNAAAWRLAMGPGGPRPSFWRTYAVTVSGFSLNYVTPMVNAGGEPYRVAALAPWLGRRGAAASVLLHKMLHSLALLLVWATALALGLVLLPHRPAVMAPLLLGLGAVGGLAALLLAGHRHGGLERALDLGERVPGLRRWARALEPRRETLAEMDRRIRALYHAAPGRFWAALGLEYLARCIWMLEYYLICAGLGLALSYPRAFVIGGLSSLAQNALFVVPYELGSKEATSYLLFRLAGLDPRAGVYAAIVSRARDVLWIAGGLALLAVLGHARRPAAALPPSEALS